MNQFLMSARACACRNYQKLVHPGSPVAAVEGQMCQCQNQTRPSFSDLEGAPE